MLTVMWRKTISLWLFSALKLPLVCWLRPRICEMTEQQSVILIKLSRRAKNHVNSMYFGALCTGADLAPGALCMHLFESQQEKFTFVFKDFQADFLRRAEGDVVFTCSEGAVIAAAIERAKVSQQRESATLHVTATVPAVSATDPVAKFVLTISLRQLGPKPIPSDLVAVTDEPPAA